MANVPRIYDPDSSLRKACERSTGLPLKSIKLTITPALCTDVLDATGYIDFPASALPASCVVFSWKCVTSVGWAGDTTATLQVGIDGTLGLYSSVTTGSVLAAGTIGSCMPTTGVLWQAAAATPRVTITGGSNFTTFVTAGTARSVVTIYYLPLP